MAYSNVCSRILSIVHFAGRDAMDIRDLGCERVRVAAGRKADQGRGGPVGVTSPATAALWRFAEVSATAGGRHCGLQTATLDPALRWGSGTWARRREAPRRQFSTMKALRSKWSVSQIRGVDQAIAEAVFGFFDEPKNRKRGAPQKPD